MTSLPGRASTNHAATCWTLHDRFRCVRTAPFATPVVPPVYCNAAGAAMSIRASGGLAAAVFDQPTHEMDAWAVRDRRHQRRFRPP